jgi:hypothetical protein
MELLEPIHSSEYLAEKLVEITDSLGITGAIFTITQDNATPNDVMLREFEAEAHLRQLGKEECLQQPWTFTQKEGDVRCIGHIINLAVQAALKHLKAVPSNSTNLYRMEADATQLPISHSQEVVVSALLKLQQHVYIFWNQRGFKLALETQVRVHNIKPACLLTLNMPI